MNVNGVHDLLLLLLLLVQVWWIDQSSCKRERGKVVLDGEIHVVRQGHVCEVFSARSGRGKCVAVIVV